MNAKFQVGAVNGSFRTGLLFGLGFSIISGLIFSTLAVGIKYADQAAVPEKQPEGPRPTVLRVTREIRNDRIVVLITVKNAFDGPVAFNAEAAIYGQDGEYSDTCPSAREFRLTPFEVVSFRALCPQYPPSETIMRAGTGNVAVQFF